MRNAKYLVLASGLLAGLSSAAHAATMDPTTTTSTDNSSLVSSGTTVFDLGSSSNDTINIDITQVHQHHHAFREMMEQLLANNTSNDLLSSADMNYINSLPGHSGLARLIHAMEEAGPGSTGSAILVLMPGANFDNGGGSLSLPPSTASAVPEPTMPMLVGGAGLAMVTGRRRPKKA